MGESLKVKTCFKLFLIIYFLLLCTGCLKPFSRPKNVTLVLRESGYDLWNPNLVTSNRLCYQRTTFYEWEDSVATDTVNEIWIANLDGANKRLIKNSGFNTLLTTSCIDGLMVVDSVQGLILIVDTTGTVLNRICVGITPLIVRLNLTHEYLYLSDFSGITRISLYDTSLVDKLVDIDGVAFFDILPGDTALLYRKDTGLYYYNFVTHQTKYISEIGGYNSSGFRINPVYPDWLVHGVEGSG